MTNFKNLIGPVKNRSFTRVHNYVAGKIVFNKKSFISIIVLFIICCNFALSALARGGLDNAIANAAGPPSPTNSREGLDDAISGAAGRSPANSASNSGRSKGLDDAISGSFDTPPPKGTKVGGLDNAIQTSLIVQAAENGANNFDWLTNLLKWATGDTENLVSQGMQYFWNSTGRAWFTNLGKLIQQYIKQLVMFIIEPIVQSLTAILVQFAYNPDVSVGTDGFSKNVQDLARWIQYLSNDLLLLFFIQLNMKATVFSLVIGHMVIAIPYEIGRAHV